MALAHYSCTSNVNTKFPEIPAAFYMKFRVLSPTNIIIVFVLDVKANLN
jgi:hypothetical protein